jgi:ABC-type nitrate/sulfonate/bicarbonate transport system substrate-binding protein
MASLAATDAFIAKNPEAAAGAVRALRNAQKALKENPARALEAGRRLFPPQEAGLIPELVARDTPYYDASISRKFVAGMNAFSRAQGILQGDPAYEKIVATEFRELWG